MLSSGLSLLYSHKLPDVLEKLLLYSIKLYIDITTSRSLGLSSCVLNISFIPSANRAHFLNITCLLFLSAAVAASYAPCPTIGIAPLISIHPSM